MAIAFVCGPYFDRELPDGSFLKKEDNVWMARHVAIELWKRDIAVICPHLNTQDFETEVSDDSIFVRGYLEIIRRIIDLMILLPNWQFSANSCREREEALRFKIPVYNDLDDFLRSREEKPSGTLVPDKEI